MRRALAFSLLVLSTLTAFEAQAATSRGLATITGSVRDNKGNPLAGALVSLMREGAKQVKEAKTDRDGNFIRRGVRFPPVFASERPLFYGRGAAEDHRFHVAIVSRL